MGEGSGRMDPDPSLSPPSCQGSCCRGPMPGVPGAGPADVAGTEHRGQPGPELATRGLHSRLQQENPVAGEIINVS